MICAFLSDRYRLEAELGTGGTGTVYRARDLVLDREVAVKVLSGTAVARDRATRLLGEARAAGRLSHPNIVTVHDAGESNGVAYVVMELVAGESLHQRRPSDVTDIVHIAHQVAAALEHAHERGIVHRDLKPENIILVADPAATNGLAAKLVDFGLALTVSSRLTAEGLIAGTVFYLAPEQALGEKVDGRADLYALGVILYELTTGQLPFVADDALAVIGQHLYAPPVPPRARNAAIPPALDALILRMLNKSPDDRPASASEVAAELERILHAPPGGKAGPADELSLLDRIVRGRLVARDRELAQARSVWQRALAGEGRTLLVSGEPGVGKTRLVRELVGQVRVSGGTALVGECYLEGGAPYAPFAQILLSLFTDRMHSDLALPDFVVADLVSLAPGLRAHLPVLPANPPLNPQSEQHRLFENMVKVCQALAERAPLLLVVEDIHWADSGTVSLFRHLARRLRDRRVLLVATYREVELDVTRPFQQALVDLNRERLTTRLKLSRLTLRGARDLLATLFDKEITDEFVAGIYRETEGNPFFMEEVVKALVESGQLYYADGEWNRPSMEDLGIPQSVRLAIQQRLAKLPDSAQQVLYVAAVVGREFDFDTLTSASALGEEVVVDALEKAEKAQLVEEVSRERGGTFVFAHALVPATLVGDLGGLRRRRIHHRVLEALQRLRPEDFEPLAYHALEAGEIETALSLSVRAAQKAHDVYAFDEAIRHYERAIEIAHALELDTQLLDLYEAIGDVHLGRRASPAVDVYQKALALTRDPRRRAQLQAKIGSAFMWLGDDQGRSYLESAIEELDPATQANELAQAIGALGRVEHLQGRYREALRHLDRARHIAEPRDDPITLSLIYAFLAGAHQHLLEMEESKRWARQLVALGERKNYPLATGVGYEYLAEASFITGRWHDTLEYAARDREIGEQSGYVGGGAWAEFSFSYGYYGLGNLPAAQEAAQKALDTALAIGDVRLSALAGAQLAMIQIYLGDQDRAEKNAREAVALSTSVGQTFLRCSTTRSLAAWLLEFGDSHEAFAQMAACEQSIASRESDTLFLHMGPMYAVAALAVGHLKEAEDLVDRLLGLARKAGSIHHAGALDALRARTLAAQGRWDEAWDAFEEAISALGRTGSRLELGRALYHLGRAQIERGRAGEGRRSLQRAVDVLQECGAAHWMAKASEALAASGADGEG